MTIRITGTRASKEELIKKFTEALEKLKVYNDEEIIVTIEGKDA